MFEHRGMQRKASGIGRAATKSATVGEI